MNKLKLFSLLFLSWISSYFNSELMSQSALDSPCNCNPAHTVTIGTEFDLDTDIDEIEGGLVSNRCYFIKGILRINIPTWWYEVRLIMDESSQIIVESTLSVDESYISACDEMWKGIKAENDANLFVYNSTIESAEFGINFSSIIGFVCLYTAFVDDYIGISAGNPFTGLQRGTVQRGQIWGCKFYTDNGLPDPYPGQYYYPSWPVVDGIPYEVGFAAIFLDGFSGMNIAYPYAEGVDRNEIYEMRNGIVLRNTVANIYSSDFDDFEGDWSSALNVPLLDINQYGIYCYSSSSIIQDNVMTNVKDGIHGDLSAQTIDDNEITPSVPMEILTRGISIRRPQKVDITSNFITNGNRGINMEEVTNKFLIDDNTLDRSIPPPPTVINAGIFIRNMFIPSNVSGRISINDIDIEDGDISLGLYLINVKNIRANGNNITYTIDEAQDYQNRGIGAVGTTLSVFEYNDVIADPGYKDFYNYGITMYRSSVNTLKCNTILNFDHNIEIDGLNLQTKLEANTIDDAMFGLYLRGPVMTGVQYHKGNLWVGSYDDFGGYIDGPIPLETAKASRFYVNTLDDADYHAGTIGPSIVAPNNIWFSDQNIIATEPECLTPSPTPFADPDSLEVLIKTELEFEDINDEITWTMKADIFELMLLDQTLQSNAVLDSFFDVEATNALGFLVSSQLKLMSRFGVEREEKDLVQDTMDKLSSDIVDIDAVIATEPIDKQDWIDLRELKVDSLSIKLTDWLTLLSEENAATLAAYEDVGGDLKVLSTGNDLEAYLKEALLFKIQYLLGEEFSGPDLEEVLYLGQLCPVFGGRAVTIAHELYANLTDSLLLPTYDNCPSPSPFIGNFGNTPQFEGDIFLIYPNPAHDNVEIRSEFTINEIYISNGLQQNIINFKPMQRNFSFSMKDLPSGVYMITIRTENGLASKRIMHL